MKKKITVSIKPDVYELLKARAKLENRSISNMADCILEDSIHDCDLVNKLIDEVDDKARKKP